MRILLLAVCLNCLSITASVAQPPDADRGVISGIVRNDKGQPLSGAKVSVRLVDGRIVVKVIRFVETDEQGRFKMDGLEWGSYSAYAMKESEGYPNTRWSIYASGSSFSVDLSPQAPNAYVEIGVGPKAGIVVLSPTPSQANRFLTLASISGGGASQATNCAQVSPVSSQSLSLQRRR